MKKIFENKWFAIGIVIIIYFLISYYKVHSTKNLPSYNPNDDTGMYWTEAAFQYRYAKMVTIGEAVPKIDYKAQYPEGVDTSLYITIFDYIIGYFYKFLQAFKIHISFHTFVIYFTCLFSYLSIFPLYFIVDYLWQNKASSIVSAIFYSISAPIFFRTLGAYEREDFALPLLFFHIYFFMRSLNNKYLLFSFVSSIFLVTALACWHFSSFYFLTFVIIFAFSLILHKRSYANIKSFLILILFCSIFSIMIPILAKTRFLFSFSIIFSYLFIIVYLYLLKYPYMNKIQLAMIFLSCIFCSFLISSSFGKINYQEYSHVFNLIKYKILYFCNKPENPALLPFEVRTLWIEAFNSPKFGLMFSQFFITIILSIVAIILTIVEYFKGNITIEKKLLLFFSLVFLGAYLFVERMHVFLNFFLAVFIGGTFKYAYVSKKRIFYILLFFCFFIIESYKLLYSAILKDITGIFCDYKINPILSSMKLHANSLELIKWVKSNTDANDVFLSQIGTAPVILTYANRPIVLHSKFETSIMRKKFEEFVNALYSSEDKFYGLCKRWNVSFFVYEINMALSNNKDSLRYIGNSLNLKKNSVCFNLQFNPKKLKHFKLCFQNFSYRVYEVENSNKKLVGNIPSIFYIPIYDLSVFNSENRNTLFFDDKNTGIITNRLIKQIQYNLEGREFLKKNLYAQSISKFESAIELGNPSADIYNNLGISLWATGKQDKAIDFFKMAISKSIYYEEGLFNLGVAYIQKKNFREAMKVFSLIFKNNSKDKTVLQNLKFLKEKLK